MPPKCLDIKFRLLRCEEVIQPVVPFADSAQAYQDMDLHPENSVKLGVAF